MLLLKLHRATGTLEREGELVFGSVFSPPSLLPSRPPDLMPFFLCFFSARSERVSSSLPMSLMPMSAEKSSRLWQHQTML